MAVDGASLVPAAAMLVSSGRAAEGSSSDGPGFDSVLEAALSSPAGSVPGEAAVPARDGSRDGVPGGAGQDQSAAQPPGVAVTGERAVLDAMVPGIAIPRRLVSALLPEGGPGSTYPPALGPGNAPAALNGDAGPHAGMLPVAIPSAMAQGWPDQGATPDVVASPDARLAGAAGAVATDPQLAGQLNGKGSPQDLPVEDWEGNATPVNAPTQAAATSYVTVPDIALAGAVTSVRQPGSATPVDAQPVSALATAVAPTGAASAKLVGGGVSPAILSATIVTAATPSMSSSPAPGLPASATAGASASGQGSPAAFEGAMAVQGTGTLPGNAGGSDLPSQPEDPGEPARLDAQASSSRSDAAQTARAITGPTSQGSFASVPVASVPRIVEGLAQSGGGRIVLTLHPEGLGELTVIVSRSHSGVDVAVRGSREAVDALSKSSILDALAARGFHSSRVDLTALAPSADPRPAGGSPEQQRSPYQEPGRDSSSRDRRAFQDPSHPQDGRSPDEREPDA